MASCVCWGSGVLRGFANVLSAIEWLLVVYLVLSVRGGGCLVHGVGHFLSYFVWQKNCSATFSAFFSNFVGVL